MRHYRLDQCLLGLSFKEPTQFLSDAVFSKRERRCNHGDRAHQFVIGVNERGEFQTTSQTRKSPDLCRAMAVVLVEAAPLRHPRLQGGFGSAVEAGDRGARCSAVMGPAQEVASGVEDHLGRPRPQQHRGVASACLAAPMFEPLVRIVATEIPPHLGPQGVHGRSQQRSFALVAASMVGKTCGSGLADLRNPAIPSICQEQAEPRRLPQSWCERLKQEIRPRMREPRFCDLRSRSYPCSRCCTLKLPYQLPGSSRRRSRVGWPV